MKFSNSSLFSTTLGTGRDGIPRLVWCLSSTINILGSIRTVIAMDACMGDCACLSGLDIHGFTLTDILQYIHSCSAPLQYSTVQHRIPYSSTNPCTFHIPHMQGLSFRNHILYTIYRILYSVQPVRLWRETLQWIPSSPQNGSNCPAPSASLFS